jgi:hypothetical protein
LQLALHGEHAATAAQRGSRSAIVLGAQFPNMF